MDYCQFLVSSLLNYSITHFADHAKKWSHDTINRYLDGEKIPPRFLWEKVRDQIAPSENGYLLFDDTVLDKNHSRDIEPVRSQWSGNEKRVIRGIGVVTCVYVNPDTDQFWSVDYRVYDPDIDGKTKIDHLREMLTNVHYQKELPFRAVLMDSWYASRKGIRHIQKLEKVYYCPIKKNRQVDETGGAKPHCRVDTLSWSRSEEREGKNRPYQEVSERPPSKTIPASDFYQPHGLHRHQRGSSKLDGGHAKGVCRPLEN